MPKKRDLEQRDAGDSPLARSSLERNAAIAALAMEGADPWQRNIVYGCYGLISLDLVGLLLPPYESAKQLWLVGIASTLLSIVIILIIWNRFHPTAAVPDINMGNHPDDQ